MWRCIDTSELNARGERVTRMTGVFVRHEDAVAYCLWCNPKGYAFRVVSG